MAVDHRRPSLIQEELSDLNELIRSKLLLMEKYPNETILKIGYDSLKNREKDLLVELKESYERFQTDVFDFVIDGNVTNNYRISLEFLGSFSYALQETVSSISQSIIAEPTIRGVIPREICARAQIDLVATATGSFRMILANHETQLGESIPKQSLRILNNLIDCEDDKSNIKQISQEVGLRSMKKYQRLMEVIYKNKADIKMYDIIVPEGFHRKEITHDLAKRIYNAISEVAEMPIETLTYAGKLTGINVRSYKFEFVIDNGEQIITGKFDDSLAGEAKRHLDTFTTIEFSVSTTYDDILGEESKEWAILAFKD